MADGDDPMWLLVGFILGTSRREPADPGHRHGDRWHHHALPPGGWHDHPAGLDGGVRVIAPPRWWLRRRAGWSAVRWLVAAVGLALVPHLLADLGAVVAALVTAHRHREWQALGGGAGPPGVEVLGTWPDREA